MKYIDENDRYEFYNCILKASLTKTPTHKMYIWSREFVNLYELKTLYGVEWNLSEPKDGVIIGYLGRQKIEYIYDRRNNNYRFLSYSYSNYTIATLCTRLICDNNDYVLNGIDGYVKVLWLNFLSTCLDKTKAEYNVKILKVLMSNL